VAPGGADLPAQLGAGLGAALAAEVAAEQHPAELRRHGAELAHPGAVVALRRVARDDVADLVAEHARQLRLVAGERQQAAAGVDVAARERERVDDVAVEDGEGEVLVPQLGRVLHPVADRLEVGLELRVLVGAAELRQHLRVLLAPDLGLVLPVQGEALVTTSGRRRRPPGLAGAGRQVLAAAR